MALPLPVLTSVLCNWQWALQHCSPTAPEAADAAVFNCLCYAHVITAPAVLLSSCSDPEPCTQWTSGNHVKQHTMLPVAVKWHAAGPSSSTYFAEICL
jgi:hypothetical protein